MTALSTFDYDLPPERIAQTPAEPRDAARLMVVERATGQIQHRRFRDIGAFLRAGDILIANDSRVLPARLMGRKATGGQVEILLLKRVEPQVWQGLVGGRRVRPGVVIHLTESLRAEVRQDLGEARRLLRFSEPLEPFLEDVGQVPLPPYITTPLADPERYQTVFSRAEGSAAAPTAGLHFTPEVLLSLREQGVLLDYVTLHIGLDTFKPVTSEDIEAHVIHREWASLTADTARRINEAKLAGGRLLAVGTTAVRTLETAGWRSAGHTGSLKEASQLAGGACPWQPVVAIEEETDLYIYPGYEFRAVDMMLTNFHLPRSTLLMLVSAFAGLDLVREAYRVAIEEEYRFYSFGDAMLII